MSNTHCPFDGNFCQKKQSRFDAWEKVIMQTDGIVFQISPDAFADCPISNPEERKQVCERYRGCLVAINNASTIMQELSQYKQNEQR